MAELADAPDLGSGVYTCRFDSCYPHHEQSSKDDCFFFGGVTESNTVNCSAIPASLAARKHSRLTRVASHTSDTPCLTRALRQKQLSTVFDSFTCYPHHEQSSKDDCFFFGGVTESNTVNCSAIPASLAARKHSRLTRVASHTSDTPCLTRALRQKQLSTVFDSFTCYPHHEQSSNRGLLFYFSGV